MGILSWWKKSRQRADERAIDSELRRETETHEEQRYRDQTGFESDERAAETLSVHDETIEDAERFADDA
jgi:hypothetical protein